EGRQLPAVHERLEQPAAEADDTPYERKVDVRTADHERRLDVPARNRLEPLDCLVCAVEVADADEQDRPEEGGEHRRPPGRAEPPADAASTPRGGAARG